MAMSRHDNLKFLAWPTYFVALLLIATPALDYVTNVWPLRPGDPMWRYGSAGVLSGFLLTPLLGIVFALCAAAVLEQRRVLRVFSFLNVLLAPLLVVVTLLFALDVLQVRGAVPEESRPVFDTGATKAAVKYLTMAVALAWFGIVGIRFTRSGEHAKGRKRSSEAAPLVRSEGAAAAPQDSGPGGKGA